MVIVKIRIMTILMCGTASQDNLQTAQVAIIINHDHGDQYDHYDGDCEDQDDENIDLDKDCDEVDPS